MHAGGRAEGMQERMATSRQPKNEGHTSSVQKRNITLTLCMHVGFLRFSNQNEIWFVRSERLGQDKGRRIESRRRGA